MEEGRNLNILLHRLLAYSKSEIQPGEEDVGENYIKWDKETSAEFEKYRKLRIFSYE